MKRELKLRIGAGAARICLSALMRTCRFGERGTAPILDMVARGQPVIFSLWHGRLLPLTWHFRGRGYVPMISHSADGEYIARIAMDWGYAPVRGSSSRGGRQALREMLEVARAGRCLVFTPDGPRGPFQQLKPGVLHAALATGLPIVPTSAAARRGSYYGRWDRFLVPHAFTRVLVAFGDPIFVAPDADQAELERKQAEVAAAMNALTGEVDALVRG
ncbi:MAG: DUF374 domain-containing protein [Gemmatimonadetes bacterium]|nr:DUF374 domain-containing protein [Gemmatimonadota bacterium]